MYTSFKKTGGFGNTAHKLWNQLILNIRKIQILASLNQ